MWNYGVYVVVSIPIEKNIKNDRQELGSIG